MARHELEPKRVALWMPFDIELRARHTHLERSGPDSPVTRAPRHDGEPHTTSFEHELRTGRREHTDACACTGRQRDARTIRKAQWQSLRVRRRHPRLKHARP